MTKQKTVTAGIAALVGISLAVVALLCFQRSKPLPVVAPTVTITATPAPTPKPAPEPAPAPKAAKTAKAAATIQAATWDFPTGDFVASMSIPPSVQRSIETFTPPATYVTGLENYNGYIPCQGANGIPDRLPCAYVFLQQQTRWILLGACPSGARPGVPAQCYCVNGMAGNSGKCKS